MGSWADVFIECNVLWIGGFMGEGDVGKNQPDAELWAEAVNLIPMQLSCFNGLRDPVHVVGD